MLYCFSLYKQGSEFQKVTNIRLLAENHLPGFVQAAHCSTTCLPATPRRGQDKSTFHSKSQRDPIFR